MNPNTNQRAQLLETWDASSLAVLPQPARDEILQDAFAASQPPGAVIYHPFDPPRLILVQTGRARVRIVSPDGRQATVRIAGHGDLLGLTTVLSGSSPLGADAITDCGFWILNVTTVRRLARTNISFASSLAESMAASSLEIIEQLSVNIFSPVRTRVGRQLLDLSEMENGRLVVKVDQQDIADGIGSVREVVSRTIRQFRDEGLVERIDGTLVLLHPQRLHRVGFGAD